MLIASFIAYWSKFELFDFEALDGQREFDMKDPEEMKNRLDVVNLSFAAE